MSTKISEGEPLETHPGEVDNVESNMNDWGSDEGNNDDLSGGNASESDVEMKREIDDKAVHPSLWTSADLVKGDKDSSPISGAAQSTTGESNTREDNLDFDVTSHKSRSGKAVILYKGYKYVLSPGRGARWKPTKPTRDWRCSQMKCGARLTTFQNDSCVLKDTVKAHDHPRSRNFNLQESNLDFNLSLGRNSRENDSLTYGGYKYRPSQLGKAIYKDRETMGAWKCRFSNCRGRLVTFMDNQCVLKDTVTEHDHPPIKKKLLLYEEFQDTIRKIISDHPEMPPDVVFSSAQLLCPHIPIVKTAPLREFIRRIQAKKQKSQPTEKSRSIAQ
ncbi:uncharacterized protein LOC131876981 isoform X2 [Tigriopus californicus]|uniref:uncharacterized protein LOC131876981 isoform X2 n=1 Tax=Tigriopus californicus TaxID=6832 RepID=UPI0027DA03C2|nr:uncharacterized protein LOC131876981 isoform X2 [Tigriopus californicus]